MKYFFLTIYAAAVSFGAGLHAQYNNSSFATTQVGLLNGASVFTVEFWVRTSENRGSDVYWQRPFLFGNETDGDNSGDFGIITNYGYIGMWEGLSSVNTDQQFLSGNIRVNDNQWHHIAAVNDGQRINLFVDGNMICSLVSGRQLITNKAPLTFGAASLDHSFAGNLQGNINFISQANFGDARISKDVRYMTRFIPSQNLSGDAFTVASFHFSDQNYNNRNYNNQGYNNQNYNNNNQGYNNNNQNYNTNYNYQSLDPDEPVTFDPTEPINDNAAKQATLFINDSVVLYGKLLLGKKDWSLGNNIYIRFFEGNSRKVKYYKPEEVKGFQIGNNYYEPKFLGQGGAISTPAGKTMVQRLTPEGSKMGMYKYNARTATKNSSGVTEYGNVVVYFVQLPHTTDDRIYQFSDNKFTPKFDTRVSAYVADNPALAEKIRSKDKNYFYAFVTDEKHKLNVWWNIVNEYNR